VRRLFYGSAKKTPIDGYGLVSASCAMHDCSPRLIQHTDAVCIDQTNVLERKHQVKNMTVIFRSALRVLVYLGEGSPLLTRLVDYIGDDILGLLPQVFDFVTLFQSRWFHRVWVSHLMQVEYATV
jgi:hypothetical protein